MKQTIYISACRSIKSKEPRGASVSDSMNVVTHDKCLSSIEWSNAFAVEINIPDRDLVWPSEAKPATADEARAVS